MKSHIALCTDMGYTILIVPYRICRMEFLLVMIVIFIIVKSFYNPNTDSISYRIGKGCGNKARHFGEWLTKDE